MAPAPVQRNLSVETTIDQVDHYGLLRQQLAAKKAALASDAARERFHDRLDEFAQPVSFADVVLLAWALQAGRWGARLLSVAAAMLIYVLNSMFMTAVQLAGAAIALALA